MKRGAIWAVVLVSALALALLRTQGSMGVPPTALGRVGLGVAVALLGLLALAEPRRRRLLTALAFAALAVAAAQDFLRPGIVWGHDLGYHSWALYSTWRSVLDGDPTPRWNPYLALGIPLLQFYGPLNYVAAWPLQALGASPMEAVKGLVIGGQLLAGLSAWAAVRWTGRSHPAALLAGGALVLAPYRLMDQTFRLALGEFLGMALLPLLFVAAWKVARGERGKAPWVLGVVTAALLLTHVLSVLMAALVWVLPVGWALTRGGERPSPRRRSAALLALTATLTITATAGWWLPMLAEQQHTAIERVIPGDRDIAGYAAMPTEVVTRQMWTGYGVRTRLGKGHPERTMPMYFGCVLLGLLGLGLSAPRDEQGPSPRVWAVPGVAALLLALDPFAGLLDALPVVSKMQFPWRLYSPASVLAALAGGSALDCWVPEGGRRRGALAALALALLAVDASPYTGAPRRYAEYEGVSSWTRDQPRQAEVPAGEFVRVEYLDLPPASYDYRVAKARVVFTEYMNVPLRQRYGRRSKPPSEELSREYGVSWRLKRGRAIQQLEPGPLVWFRPDGGEYAPLPGAAWSQKPESIEIELPGGLPRGSVRFVGGWFVGWESRVDGGEWERARRSEGLLAARTGADARRVQFHFALLSPWDRPVGLGLSWATFALLAVLWRRVGRGAALAAAEDRS